MRFVIQAGCPRVSGKKDFDAETLDECVEASFLLDSEKALIDWQGVFIPLPYKYSISTILLDILNMLRSLLDQNQGDMKIVWPSSDFSGEWVLSWRDDDLLIRAKWESVIGNLEHTLNDLGELRVSREAFVSEWKSVLGNIINGMNQCGYNEADISDLSVLKELHRRIDNAGVLYR